MERLKIIKSLGEAADRDMHFWWDEYDQLMSSYRQKRNASICTDADMLRGLLTNIKNKVEMVK